MNLFSRYLKPLFITARRCGVVWCGVFNCAFSLVRLDFGLAPSFLMRVRATCFEVFAVDGQSVDPSLVCATVYIEIELC